MIKSLLAKKILFLILSGIVAIIALFFIEGLIEDRWRYQNEAKQSVARGWSSEQQIIGPLLVVPFSYIHITSRTDKNDKVTITEDRRYKELYIMPEEIYMDTKLVTQERSRGIFSFPVYTAEIAIKGTFDLPTVEALIKERYEKDVMMMNPYLSVALNDVKGINNKPVLTWQDSTYKFEVGSNIHFASQGIHAPLPSTHGKADFSFDLSVRGMDALWFTPIGKDTHVKLDAAWAHPSFSGHFLPNERTITDESFQANWQISDFSSNISRDLISLQYRNNDDIIEDKRFGVYLNTPVDIYRQSIRSTKYGLLFVGLTFISFFVFEILKKLQIHPIQYTLVSLSLTIFYLLLIALSEAFGFMLAYIGATVACVALLTFYVSAILRNIRWGLGFGGFVTALYALLYVILNSEDHALLLGSGLVFVMLGLVMFATRHLDWYQISAKSNEKKDDNLKI